MALVGGGERGTAAAARAAVKEARRHARGTAKACAEISTREHGDLVMLGIGGFSPLTRFLGRADWARVCDAMLLADGTFWPVPITLAVDAGTARTLTRGDMIALTRPRLARPQRRRAESAREHHHQDDDDDEGNEIVGTIKVDDVWEMGRKEREMECGSVYGTLDYTGHPGVKVSTAQAQTQASPKSRL
jgi:sulfate adenylyltransferase